MRQETQLAQVRQFLEAVAQNTRGPGTIYLVGGACAVWFGWRQSTIDIDIACAPEPAGLFSAIEGIKNSLNVNVELAAPSQFVPPLPGWQMRSEFIARIRSIDFYHYDFYSQALAKLSRGHQRDLGDAQAMLHAKKIQPGTLLALVEQVKDDFLFYPNLQGQDVLARIRAWVATHG